MFSRVLIANRGEIALRIVRACRQLGIETVGVHSDVDADLMHLRLVDTSVCIGPAPASESYLNIPAIISAMEISGADAVHPGYGFLAENVDFAHKVESSGYKFIGPKPELISSMGDKASARKLVAKMGMPIIPGSDGILEDASAAAPVARKIGYPVILKASAGGGGRGTRVVESEQELREAFDMASLEAEKAFGNGDMYMEKFLARPQHIEIQVACDGKKGIHLGERNCSLQRRRQKIMEEGPVPGVNQKALANLRKTSVKICEKIGYCGVGTVEALYENGSFYFLEMNTRIQVEHPVSEMLTGVDLVEIQLRVAAGEPLPLKQEDITLTGHVVECRLNAEDPETFRPSPGTVTALHIPSGPGVRFDSHLYTGYKVPPHYDSLVGKLICWGKDRESAMARMEGALEEFYVEGISTLQPLHQKLLRDPTVRAGDIHVNYLEKEFLARRLGPSGDQAGPKTRGS